MMEEKVIKEMIKGKLQEIESLQMRIRAARVMIDYYRVHCDHSDLETGNTWGRWPYTKCQICGKEW